MITAEIVAFELPEELNVTSSLAPGTDALLEPPDVALQFVGAVAFQFAELPPPTQNRAAIIYLLLFYYF